MRSKKLLVALIATLVLLSTGCGSNPNSNFTSEKPETFEAETSYSRFTSKEVEVSGDNPSWFFEYSYIITDNETGKQYLYLYHDNGYDGGAVIVELGTVDIVESDN